MAPGVQIFVQIEWENIPLQYQAQFSTYRWTVGYGEKYDYESIMHYSSRAFVRVRYSFLLTSIHW